MFNQASIADLREAELVEQLLADPVWRNRIARVKGMSPDALAFTRVPLTGAPGKYKGDIDILLCRPNKPSVTVAIEVKRIKVSIRALRDGKPNKLGELVEGIRQSNLLATMGFAQVYFYVFVAVDSREKTLAAPNAWAGPSQELRQLLHDSISVDAVSRLDRRVGVFRHQFVQPVDDRPLGTGSYSGELVRLTQISAQSPDLTQWVAKTVETLTPVQTPRLKRVERL